MRRTIHLSVLATVILTALLALTASTAQAQWYGPYGPRVRVYVGFGWGYPYWGWGPGGWGYPYWGYPYWGWGPWYGYPYYVDPPDNSGKVRLEVKPKDAQVYADGYYAGMVDDFDGTFGRLHLPPGDHEIVVYKPGFRTVKQSIRLRPRQDSTIRFALQPLPPGETAEEPPPPPKREERPQPPEMPAQTPPPEPAPPSPANEARAFGMLVVRAQPAGVEILIDGERWQTPEGEERLNVRLAEGTHRVEIRKEGFRPFATEVTVRAGETTPLNVSLPPRNGVGSNFS